MILGFAAILVGLALVFVGWPLLRAPRDIPLEVGDSDPRSSAAKALYQQRRAELQQEAAAGLLTPAGLEEALGELGATLLDDMPEPALVASASSPQTVAGALPGWLKVVVLVCLPFAAYGLYYQVGEPDAVLLVGAEEVLTLAPESSAELTRWRERFQRRLRRAPEDAKSWYLLGHVQLKLEAYTQATQAFATAHSYLGPDQNIDLYWLQAGYLANSGQLTPELRGVADRVLKTTPNHPLVLEILAIAAFREGQYQESVSLLNRALSNPLSPPQRATLAAGLREARTRLGKEGPQVDVHISLPVSSPANAVLFVIARPVGGGMPYAVVRRHGPDYPDSVILDDAVSMNPTNPLSAAQEVEVVVRLSLSGATMARPGDWEWRSAPIRPGDISEPLAVTLAPPETS